MRCEFCGHINDQGVKFCARCGSPFNANQTPGQYAPNNVGYNNAAPNNMPPNNAAYIADQKPKQFPLKKILIIAIPVVVVIIAAIILFSVLGGSGGALIKDNISFFTDRGTVIVSGNSNPKFSLDGNMHSSQKSMDGSKAAVMMEYSSNTGGELWFVTTSTSYQIADDVVAYRLSDSGNGVAFITDYDSRNDVATLILYDTSSKTATKITEDVFYYGSSEMLGICISPNGKSVSYISDYDERDDEFTGYIKVDGKTPERLGKNTFAVAVSDGGRHLYYIKLSDNGYTGSLYVRSGRNDNRLASDMSLGQSIALNRDYSEVLVTVDDRTYISRNGNERERVGGSSIYSLIVPDWTQVGYSAGTMGITVYGIRGFSGFVGYTGDGLVYINSRLESSRISSSSNYGYRATLSADGKTLLYINNNGHLSIIDPTREGAERREVARNVSGYVATSNLKTIYYVNEDDELWCARGNGVPVKISDDVSPNHLALANNSNKVFFLVDYSSSRGGELFYSINGGRRAAIGGADEVRYLWSTAANIFFITRDDETYRSNGNENFSLFAEDIVRAG